MVVALVPVAEVKVKFWKMDWLRTPVEVAKYEPEYSVLEVAAIAPALVQYAMEPTAPPDSGAW